MIYILISFALFDLFLTIKTIIDNKPYLFLLYAALTCLMTCFVFQESKQYFKNNVKIVNVPNKIDTVYKPSIDTLYVPFKGDTVYIYKYIKQQ